MALAEMTCVACGRLFTLLPGKPGLINMCPQCSVPVVEPEIVERKPRNKRLKSVAEVIADHERRQRRRQKLMDLIKPRGNRP
jgi:hypothetical protein